MVKQRARVFADFIVHYCPSSILFTGDIQHIGSALYHLLYDTDVDKVEFLHEFVYWITILSPPTRF